MSLDPFYKMECTSVSISDNDKFEAIDQICWIKKQRPNVKCTFDYLTKMEITRNVSLDDLPKRMMNLEKERKIFNRIFNSRDSFYVAESDIHDTMPSIPRCEIQSTVSTPLSLYDETNSYKSYELKDLQTETTA